MSHYTNNISTLIGTRHQGVANNMNGRGHGARIVGPAGGHRGPSRGYGPQSQHHDYYDPTSDRGGVMNQGPTSARLANHALNVTSPSNIPSNSGKKSIYSYLSRLNYKHY